MVDPSIVETYTVGKEGFIVALCEALGVPEIINQSLGATNGRPTDIPYGVDAMLMMVNMCHDHYPLSRLKEYYQYTDLEALFHHPITLDQINDDRFGGFLDLFHEAGCKKIFSQIAAKAVSLYGIQVKNINFDTTSKVMWGQYETPEGTTGVIEMNFGHSKNKREDKKQIKFGIGCDNGLVVDAVVLSGNKDDKTYNTDTLNAVDETLNNLSVDKDNFYYIADSALFSEGNLTIACEKGIKLITRMPDNVLQAREAIEEAVNKSAALEDVEIKNAKGQIVSYHLLEQTCKYKGHELKLTVCYSECLKATKIKTVDKAVEKETELILKVSKALSKREFACIDDANREIDKVNSKEFKKLKFHDISYSLRKEERRKRGRPAKDAVPTTEGYYYFVDISSTVIQEKVTQVIDEACCFVLCSNDLSMSGEKMLREYKTQDCVEKKFQQLKSPQFVNSIYLESPQRIEAFSYLMLICILMLSLAEYVVRRGLSQDGDYIIGPANVKMKRPTQRAIYDIFYAVRIRVICYSDRPWERSFAKPLNDSLKKVLKYLRIPENTFIRGSS
ncbi:MAG: IS1634 family transposase [Firmicutes bacterium]|nr:IS1634 family transposase [Bacillota bacterium]